MTPGIAPDREGSALDTAGQKEQKSNMSAHESGMAGVFAARARLTRADFGCAVPRAMHG
jgi:hypothetical protein